RAAVRCGPAASGSRRRSESRRRPERPGAAAAGGGRYRSHVRHLAARPRSRPRHRRRTRSHAAISSGLRRHDPWTGPADVRRLPRRDRTCAAGARSRASLEAQRRREQCDLVGALLDVWGRVEIDWRVADYEWNSSGEWGAAIRVDSTRSPETVTGWISLLGDADPSVRARAAISLGVVGDPRAVDPLTSTLVNDAASVVRRQAATELGVVVSGVGDQRAIREAPQQTRSQELTLLRADASLGYFEAIVGFTQPFFITPCDGRKLR